jgi:hypothetical protein
MGLHSTVIQIMGRDYPDNIMERDCPDNEEKMDALALMLTARMTGKTAWPGTGPGERAGDRLEFSLSAEQRGAEGSGGRLAVGNWARRAAHPCRG